MRRFALEFCYINVLRLWQLVPLISSVSNSSRLVVNVSSNNLYVESKNMNAQLAELVFMI